MSGVTSLNGLTGVVACQSTNTGALSISGAGQNVVFQPLSGGVTEITADGQVTTGPVKFIDGTGITITNDGFGGLTFTGGAGGGNWSYRGVFVATSGTAYALNDVAFDTTNTAQTYVCILAYTTGASALAPSADATHWRLFAINSASSISNGTGSVTVGNDGGITATSVANMNLTASGGTLAIDASDVDIGGSSVLSLEGSAGATLASANGPVAITSGASAGAGTLTVGGASTTTGLYVSNTSLLFNGSAVGGGSAGGQFVAQRGAKLGNVATGTVSLGGTVAPFSTTYDFIDFAPPLVSATWYGGGQVSFIGTVEIQFGQCIPAGANLQWLGLQLVDTNPGTTTVSPPYIFPTPIALVNPPPTTTNVIVTSPYGIVNAYTPPGVSGTLTAKQYSLLGIFQNEATITFTTGVASFSPYIEGGLNNFLITSPAIAF